MLMIVHATVGAASSRPPANGPGCSVEWHYVGHRANSPNLVPDSRMVPRGRLVAAPTIPLSRKPDASKKKKHGKEPAQNNERTPEGSAGGCT